MNQTTTPDSVYFSVKGQVVIPRRLRQAFDIKQGTRATVTATPQGILITPITPAYLKGLRGSLKGKGAMKTLLDDRKREREL
jgi:AbrB family looped-hinge helix DNA binding protein